MATQKITNNEELNVLISTMNPSKKLFAIATKGQIEVFETKKSFEKAAKKLPNAVQGPLTPFNYMWYRF
jgi:predicted regulator of amino acid metabolism with ACT domain